VATNADGEKLSKQTRAADARANDLPHALEFLGMPAPAGTAGNELLQWAVQHWDPDRVPPVRGLIPAFEGRSP
jgi:hypothetical protein